MAQPERDQLPSGPFVCLTSLPGNRHRIGLYFLAALLHDNAIPTVLLSHWTRPDELVRVLSNPACAAVGFSVSMPHQVVELERCRALIGRMNPRPVIVVGGRATNQHPEVFRAPGEFVDPRDNEERVRLFRALLERRGRE